MKEKIERLIKDLQEKEKEERESADIYRKIYDGYKKEGIEDHDFKRYEERETAHADGILFARRKLENILEDMQRTEEDLLFCDSCQKPVELGEFLLEMDYIICMDCHH